jgi:hypothetical protein
MVRHSRVVVMNPPRALTGSQHAIAEAITDEVMVQVGHHTATGNDFLDFLNPWHKDEVHTVPHVQQPQAHAPSNAGGQPPPQMQPRRGYTQPQSKNQPPPNGRFARVPESTKEQRDAAVRQNVAQANNAGFRVQDNAKNVARKTAQNGANKVAYMNRDDSPTGGYTIAQKGEIQRKKSPFSSVPR